jgi:hypothetical protein
LKKQDNILEKFKNNSKFIDILEKAKKKGFNNPFVKYMDNKDILCCLFSYGFFEEFHLCLQDLFTINDISKLNFIKITNLLS